MDGGIFALLGLIRHHRGAVEYDLRTRCSGLGLRDVGSEITLPELHRLVMILRNDPSSAIATALAGWEYPMTREGLLLADLYDLTVAANSDPKKGKARPHPGRPYRSADRQEERFGNTGGRTRAEVVAILNKLGHQLVA